MELNSGIIRHSYQSILYYLSSRQKRLAAGLFVLLFISSLLEAFSLAALVPVLLIAAEPHGILKNKYTSYLFHALQFSNEKMFILFMIIAVFLFFAFKNVFATWVLYLQSRFTSNVGLTVVTSQLNKYINLPLLYFTDIGSAKFLYSTLQATYFFVNSVMRPLFAFFSEIMIITIIIFGILLYEPKLVLLMVLIMGPAAWVTYSGLRKRTQYIGSQTNARRPLTIGLLNNIFNGFVELKLANKQEQLRDKLLANQNKIHLLDAESYVYTFLPLKIIEMVAILGLLTIFIYSVFLSDSPKSSMTLLGLFAGAAYRLMPSINRMLTSMVSMKQYQTTIEELALYRSPEYDASVPKSQLPLQFKKEISLNKVSFSFPGTDVNVLSDINLTIKKGEIVGFIGSSGSGKTTLMNILLRFYIEKLGHIKIDDEVLTANHLRAWHRLIGYVKQDTFLMESSIRENITLFDQAVDEARLRDALEKASLADFVDSLPDGLDTLIGERGSKLSGGQRQRIGIARALYKQSEILIMDEATSALDNETEKEVNEAIHNLSSTNITILIVAHRLTTLRDCDYIVELDQGKIVARYDYDTLIKEKLFN